MLIIIIILNCTAGCTGGLEVTENKENDILQTDSLVSPMATGNNEKELIQNCLNKYYEFLNGEISVNHNQIKNSMYGIDDIFRADENHNKFTFYDSNDNGIPELHLSSPRYYEIIEYVNDDLKTIYDGTGYETLLNNGAVLYTRYGGAPDHISYKYTELDPDNNTIQTTFEKYNGDMEGDYDYFLLDGEEVTKSEFDTIAEKYLNIGADWVIWSDYWTFLFNANSK